MFQISLAFAPVDEFSWEWMVFKSNYPLTSLSRQKIHRICHCIPCQVMKCTWSDNDNRYFPKTRKKTETNSIKLNWCGPTRSSIAHLNILISTESSLLWSFFFMTQHSEPYVIAGLMMVSKTLFLLSTIMIYYYLFKPPFPNNKIQYNGI